MVASKVRFLPHSPHPRTVCMRVEVYGCPYSSPILSYTAPPGDEFARGLYLEDIYDGLSAAGGRGGSSGGGGLGLLTDGQIGTNQSFAGPGPGTTPSLSFVYLLYK